MFKQSENVAILHRLSLSMQLLLASSEGCGLQVQVHRVYFRILLRGANAKYQILRGEASTNHILNSEWCANLVM